MGLCSERRGDLLEQATAGEGRVLLRYMLPLSELATDLYSEIKARSQGYVKSIGIILEYHPGIQNVLFVLKSSPPITDMPRLIMKRVITDRLICSASIYWHMANLSMRWRVSWHAPRLTQ